MTNSTKTIRSICVYCGSQLGASPEFEKAAIIIGKSIADHGLKLIYGGGTYGIMGAVAGAAMDAGGHVTGIIPEFLLGKEGSLENVQHLSDYIITENMHERKHKMFEHADAFLTLPGGIGTLEELTEIMTWAQLGRHNKPILIANIDGFWDPLTQLISHMSEQGFIHTQNLVKPLVIDKAEDVIPTLMKL